MTLDAADLAAVRLTLELATVVTVLLLVVGTPVAWWLARTRSRLRHAVGAVVALPLVLPPTVIGFYLLLLLGPQGYDEAFATHDNYREAQVWGIEETFDISNVPASVRAARAIVDKLERVA